MKMAGFYLDAFASEKSLLVIAIRGVCVFILCHLVCVCNKYLVLFTVITGVFFGLVIYAILTNILCLF